VNFINVSFSPLLREQAEEDQGAFKTLYKNASLRFSIMPTQSARRGQTRRQTLAGFARQYEFDTCDGVGSNAVRQANP
jgi:hypothetical protein